MEWSDDQHGEWRLFDGGRIVGRVVQHLDGWRGFVNPSGAEVPGAPFDTLQVAQEAVERAL